MDLHFLLVYLHVSAQVGGEPVADCMQLNGKSFVSQSPRS